MCRELFYRACFKHFLTLGAFLVLCTLGFAGCFGVLNPTRRSVILFLYYLCFAGKLCFANRAIYNWVIRAFGFTIRINKVFFYSFGRGMVLELFYRARFKHFLALGAFLVLCTFSFAGRRSVLYPIGRSMYAIPFSVNAHIAWYRRIKQWICGKRLFPNVVIPIPTAKSISFLCWLGRNFYNFLAARFYGIV